MVEAGQVRQIMGGLYRTKIANQLRALISPATGRVARSNDYVFKVTLSPLFENNGMSLRTEEPAGSQCFTN